MDKSQKFREYFREYARILKLTRKPSREEFTMIAKIAGAGILLIGLIGFFIYLAMTSIPQLIISK